MARQKDGQTEGWTARMMDIQKDGQTEGWTDRRMDRPKDGQTDVPTTHHREQLFCLVVLIGPLSPIAMVTHLVIVDMLVALQNSRNLK